MALRSLSQDVVALIHHVELAAAGWRERLSEQLLLAAIADSTHPRDVEALTLDVSKELGRTLSAGTLTAACQRLVGRGLVIRSTDQQIVLTQTGADEVRRRREASSALEEQAKGTFVLIATQVCPGLAAEDLWTQFLVGCLEPTVTELGARTYQFITAQSVDHGVVRSMAAFIDRFPTDAQPGVKRLIDRFLDPSNSHVRAYVLQQLNAHFLTLAASISDATLSSLSGRLRRAVQLKLFLDTNFLFSVLDLHDNPANDAARELVALLKRLHGKLDYKLFVYPLTIDEVKRTLVAYEQTLAGAYLTPKLGRAAMSIGPRVSGLVLRYLRAVAESKGRISARDFLAPYLNDPVSVLRSKGVELYNENVDRLTTTQPVIDDIVDQQTFEATRYPDKAKPYEALRHDIALWHLVTDKRAAGLATPLDAIYWVVTIDYRFLGFDAHKTRGRPSALPTCVHPAVLLQMLQLWLPRDESVDRALLQGIRSLLPSVFDSQAEEATVRILTTLARYENVDDLDENTITQVLMNQALGDRIRMVDDVRQQVELVREAIVTQYAQAKAQLAEEQKRRDELQQALTHQQALLAAASERHGTEYNALIAEKQRVQDLLEKESKDREALANRVAGLEESLRRTEETRVAELESLRHSRQTAFFVFVAALAVALALVLSILLPESLAGSTGMSIRRARLTIYTGTFGLAGFATWLAGRLLPTIRVSVWFHKLTKTLLWAVGVIWTIFLGVVSTYL